MIIPPTTSQFLNLTKNSSLAVAIGYPDLISVPSTTLNQTGQAIEAHRDELMVGCISRISLAHRARDERCSGCVTSGPLQIST